jgi:hypothetical protein
MEAGLGTYGFLLCPLSLSSRCLISQSRPLLSHRSPFSARGIIGGGLLRFLAVRGAAEKLDFGHWRSPVACPSCAKGPTCFANRISAARATIFRFHIRLWKMGEPAGLSVSARKLVLGLAGRTAIAQVNPRKAIPEIPETDAQPELASTFCAVTFFHGPSARACDSVREASIDAPGIQMRGKVP